MKTRGDFLKKTAIPKKTLYLWQFRVFLIGGLLCLLCLDYRKNLQFLNIVAIALAVLALFIIIGYLPKFFNGYEIVFKGDAVIINYGVFIKFTHINTKFFILFYLFFFIDYGLLAPVFL